MATRLNYPLSMPLKMLSNAKRTNGYHLKVCIGTDSQVKGAETEFATVIVFLREGHGGFMFIHNEKTRQLTVLKNACWLKWPKALKLLTNSATCLLLYDVTWKFMPTSIPIRILKATMHLKKPWAIFWEWALPLKPNPKPLPAAVAPIKW